MYLQFFFSLSLFGDGHSNLFHFRNISKKTGKSIPFTVGIVMMKLATPYYIACLCNFDFDWLILMILLVLIHVNPKYIAVIYGNERNMWQEPKQLLLPNGTAHATRNLTNLRICSYWSHTYHSIYCSYSSPSFPSFPFPVSKKDRLIDLTDGVNASNLWQIHCDECCEFHRWNRVFSALLLCDFRLLAVILFDTLNKIYGAFWTLEMCHGVRWW